MSAAEAPDWQVAVVDGQPEVVVNRAAIEVLIRESPLGEAEARRQINHMLQHEIAAGRIEAF